MQHFGFLASEVVDFHYIQTERCRSGLECFHVGEEIFIGLDLRSDSKMSSF